MLLTVAVSVASRSLVPDTVAQQIACSIVGSRLDYCNSLLVNCSNRNLDKLQRVQDNLARVVCNSNRSASAGPLLRSLHWLPVRQRINFKLAKLCYLVTSFQQPGYLADLISPVQSVSFVAVVHTEVSVSSAAQLGHYCSSFLSCCSKTLELSSSELSNCCIC